MDSKSENECNKKQINDGAVDIDNLSINTSHADVTNEDDMEVAEITNDYNTIEVIPESPKNTAVIMEGRRIVDIQHFIDNLKIIGDHNKAFGCTLKNLIVQKEEINGLESKIIFKCNMCNVVKSIECNVGANVASVIGVMNVGSGYSHLGQITAALNIPCMSSPTYLKHQEKVSDAWEAASLDSIIEAGLEERRLAIENGDVTENGTATITVLCDGSWAKRSYRTNYNSLSGAAAIVGYKTKKVLYLGVKNKFCIQCNKHKDKESVPEHACYKNWQGSSTAMEAAIIAEGFQTSVKMHGLIYKFMVADGDSSTFKRVKDLDPYKTYGISVQKIECKNHLLRNFSNKIRELTKDTEYPIILRNKIKASTYRITSNDISF